MEVRRPTLTHHLLPASPGGKKQTRLDGDMRRPEKVGRIAAAPARSEAVPDGVDEKALAADPKLYRTYLTVRALLMGDRVGVAPDSRGAESGGSEGDTARPAESPAQDLRDLLSAAYGASSAAPAATAPSSPAPPAAPSPSATESATLQQSRSAERVELSVQVNPQQPPQVAAADPIILDLDNDGIELTTAQDGAAYDLTGDGMAETAALVAPDDGLLVMDRDGDGAISSGAEFFGDQHGAVNGFAELARFDDNQDRVIDAADAVYERLRVFQDQNQDGNAAAGELSSLAELGIASISLAYSQADQVVAGNRITETAAYTKTDGSQGQAADAHLNYLV
ncbi:MAG: hypothetical protein HYV63_19055 [Candidatus Schekmanbacteria bacterium]|nr:hypothetical protein [Candidatus Schekmanbacteria bacterium]